MPRYMVHRTWPEKLELPVDNGGAEICRAVVERNGEEGVNWVHSYVSADKRTTSASTTAPPLRRSVRRPRATATPSTRSPR